ncbi:MAG: cytochrome c biogenesis protein ResB [Acidobacteria bacterium]|nr:cytochrome c biogenesis protein ResB [Acidobacteriota bacterium]
MSTSKVEQTSKSVANKAQSDVKEVNKIEEKASETAKTQAASAASIDSKVSDSQDSRREKSIVDDFLKLLSSVKFGIALLVLLMIFSMIGTFVVQEGTSDFQKFYESLTPAEESLYRSLGFFDIYHAWYFNLLLLTLALNIILATIDRAPGYWHFFVKPKLTASENYARYQPWYAQFRLSTNEPSDVIKKVSQQANQILMPSWALMFGPLAPILSKLSSIRFRVTEENNSTTVFIERGVWNRYAFCLVHIGLLTILVGWFVGIKWGQKGVVSLAPGEASSTFISANSEGGVNTYQMPFRLICYDIEQQLIDSKKPDLSPSNTLDWHTRVIFEDGQKRYDGNVHLNNPVDFRGYRFFQASFDEMTSARNLTLLLIPKDGKGQAQEVTIKRPSPKSTGSVEVPDLGTIRWKDFYPNFQYDPKAGKPFSSDGSYARPVADLEILLADGTLKNVYGFTQAMMESVKQAPFLVEKTSVGDYDVILKDFEKVSRAHTLQIQYDPGVNTIYWGCAFLVFALLVTFFFSHERIWVYIKPGENNELNIHFAGNTSRNKPAFDLRYGKLLGLFQNAFKEASMLKLIKPEEKLGK